MISQKEHKNWTDSTAGQYVKNVDENDRPRKWDSMRAAIKSMKSVEEADLNDIPVDKWKCLREMTLEVLTRFFNKILKY